MQGLRDQLPASYFTLIKPLDHTDFPWLGVLVGMPINSMWYWCTDQVMVQRVLAAKDVRTGQQACVFAGWLKILPMYLMVLPGLIAAALYPDAISESPNRAFALLVTRLLPHGWQGPMIAVMLSSFMAALSSCFNSCSTLFTLDVYAQLAPGHSEAELVRVGRGFTLILAAASLAWMPVIMSSSSQLFLYIQEMQVIWCSPVVTVFLASITSDAVSESTAWWTLWIGLGVSFAVWLARQFTSGCAALALCPIVEMNVLHFTIMLFAFDALLLLALHYGDKRRHGTPEEQLPLATARAPRELVVVEKTPAGWVTQVCALALPATVISLTIWHSV